MLQRQKQENWDSFFSVTIAFKCSRSAGPGPGAPGRAGQVGRADGAGRADRAGRTKRARPSGPLGWPGRARTGLARSGPAVPGPARSARAGRPRLPRILGSGSPGSSVPGKGCVGFPGKHRDVYVEAQGRCQQSRLHPRLRLRRPGHRTWILTNAWSLHQERRRKSSVQVLRLQRLQQQCRQQRQQRPRHRQERLRHRQQCRRCK